MVLIKKKIFIVFGIMFLIVIVIYNLMGESNEEVIDPVNNNINTSYNQIIVEVKGEVNRPGIYIVLDQERLYKVINLAGGFTDLADTNQINLAQKVNDGSVIFIPRKNKEETTVKQKISINNASLEELMQLKGIGEVKARSIIIYREQMGKFLSIEGLLEVNGISENIFNQIKDDICL